MLTRPLIRSMHRAAGRVVLVLTLVIGLGFFLSSPAPGAISWHLGDRLVPGPLPPNPKVPAPGLDQERDVVYGNVTGQDLKLDLAKPSLCRAQKVPLVIYIHGGGWSQGDKSGVFSEGFARMLFQLGFAVASIDYRLAPEFLFPAQVNDCKLAIRFLRANADRFGIDPARFGVMGASAGGHLALFMGLAGKEDGLEGPGLEGVSSRVLAVVNYFGPTDLTQEDFHDNPVLLSLLGCHPTDCPDRARAASPVNYVTPDDPPVMTIHGDKDGTVPYTQAVIISEKLRAAGNACGLIKVNNADHGFVPNPANAVIVPSLERIHFITVAHLARYLEPALFGDLNMDGRIDRSDLLELFYVYSARGVGPGGLEAPDAWNPLADLDPDGIIDFNDGLVFWSILMSRGNPIGGAISIKN
jgi:acetyl esterase/lipase